ncbi:MAG: hypothetical protein L0154_07065 [Chloroflexi bacterium]|nr:hypothetical protein [Chloroflexota bacterium]
MYFYEGLDAGSSRLLFMPVGSTLTVENNSECVGDHRWLEAESNDLSGWVWEGEPDNVYLAVKEELE